MGRKKKTLNLKEKPQYSGTVNCSVTARNLRKSELAGAIFGCTHWTIGECFSKKLFGLPVGHFSYVKNITPGLPLFLFNYSDRKLHGIFEAASPGQLNIDAYGWSEDGATSTPYAAQIRVRVQRRCLPLLEEKFAAVIADNYFENKMFWFELDRVQTHKLVNLFLSSPVPGESPRSRFSYSKRDTTNDGEELIQEVRCGDRHLNMDHEGSSASVLANLNSTNTERPWSSLFKTSVDVALPIPDHSSDVSPYQDVCTTFYESWEDQCVSAEEPLNTSWCNSASMLTAENKLETSFLDLGNVVSKLESWEDQCLSSEEPLPSPRCTSSPIRTTENKMEASSLDLGNVMAKLESWEDQCVPSEEPLNLPWCTSTSVLTTENKGETSSLDLRNVVAKLVEEVGVLKVCQLKQSLRISALEEELIDSKLQIQQLRNKPGTLASWPCSSGGGLSQKVVDILDKPRPEVDDSVVLVGGFDGSSWLSAMDSYSLSCDSLNSLRPMTFIRSFPAVTKMNGEIFVLGGARGDVWYDKVESYSPAKNQWASLPSLNKRKGSLAGASLCGKIFACGGQNGVESFSEVEMFDPNTGRWIFIQAMHQKRFASAVAELDGALYTVGGYDGTSYLNSVERFDPRERSWTGIASMRVNRGCHSLVTLNGKLFALGGYDGSRMVSTTEIFDPRAGSWMMAEPMNESRGYFGATVINGRIYAIGGESKGNILDTIEYYEEDRAWQVINLKAMGKRCSFSAVVIGGEW